MRSLIANFNLDIRTWPTREEGEPARQNS